MRNRKGFTMIELLIVIAILGVLAVAVLSAINPLEQIRRGRDTGSRSDAEQLINALDRYYSSHGYFPWQTSEGDTSGFTWTPSSGLSGQWASTMSGLISADEVKTGFTSRLSNPTGNSIYLFYNGTSTSNSTYACFLPQSKSMKIDAAADCKNRTSQTDFPLSSACNACTSGTWNGTASCYVCLP